MNLENVQRLGYESIRYNAVKVMNKICCFITGGHKYKSSDLECKFDDNEDMVIFINHCDKCGKIYEVSIPQSSILRDFK